MISLFNAHKAKTNKNRQYVYQNINFMENLQKKKVGCQVFRVIKYILTVKSPYFPTVFSSIKNVVPDLA